MEFATLVSIFRQNSQSLAIDSICSKHYVSNVHMQLLIAQKQLSTTLYPIGKNKRLACQYQNMK